MLTACALFDNRTISDLTAKAWSKAIAPIVTYSDAVEAVADHYAESSEWIMPADINRRVRAIRRTRTAALAPPAPPEPLTADRDLAWRREYTRVIGDGKGRDEAEEHANHILGLQPAQLVPPPTEEMRALVQRYAKTPDRSDAEEALNG